MAKDTQPVETPKVEMPVQDAVKPTQDTEVTMKFTTQELEVLVNLLDSAVRAQGLNAAQGGWVLATKVQQALTEHGIVRA